jgi:hypothetical protein
MVEMEQHHLLAGRLYLTLAAVEVGFLAHQRLLAVGAMAAAVRVVIME